MLKRRAIVALLIMLQVHPLQAQAPTQPSDHVVHSQGQQKPGSQPTAMNYANTFTSGENAGKQYSLTTQDPDRWVRRGFWINAVLTLITLFLAIATLMQAVAAKHGAKAALLNAQAVINAERPWLLENITRIKDSDREWIVSMRNAGNTPADVVDGYWCASTLSGDFNLPAEFRRSLFLLQNTVIVKTDSFEVTRIDTRPLHDAAMSGFRDPDGGAVFKLLYLHGETRYWDTFTDRSSPIAKPHVTQWCYVYNPHAEEFTRAPCTYHNHT